MRAQTRPRACAARVGDSLTAMRGAEFSAPRRERSNVSRVQIASVNALRHP
jgi:hypothetical protein